MLCRATLTWWCRPSRWSWWRAPGWSSTTLTSPYRTSWGWPGPACHSHCRTRWGDDHDSPLVRSLWGCVCNFFLRIPILNSFTREQGLDPHYSDQNKDNFFGLIFDKRCWFFYTFNSKNKGNGSKVLGSGSTVVYGTIKIRRKKTWSRSLKNWPWQVTTIFSELHFISWANRRGKSGIGIGYCPFKFSTNCSWLPNRTDFLL